MTERKTPETLRSARWFAKDDMRSFAHRSRMMQMGLGPEDWAGRPIIALLNTWSEAQPCHLHFRDRALDVKRGIQQAGGHPMELPALSLSESLVKPSTMLYRNLLAMEAEELIRSHPVDGVVLMGGCDKTTPALVMGAISAGVPMIYMPAGPMMRGHYRGRSLGSGSDIWKYWDERRAGAIDDKEWTEIEGGIARSPGHCMTMGTASTMTAIAEAMGLPLPGASSIPAMDANHARMAAGCGRRIVDMVWENLTPDALVTPASVRNAGVTAMAMGCSTNAVIHLIAMARRAGVTFGLDDFDALGRDVPVIANIRPSGDRYLMEDFYLAGGLRALMARLGARIDPSPITVTGRPIGETLTDAQVHDDDVIRPLDNPIYPEGALAVLRGNLAPDGAVMKPCACAPHLLVNEGRALVFDSYPEMKAATDDPDLDVEPNDVLVLRNAGPIGGPGMPEWGMLPIPIKLIRQGVRDMVRLSDARMSGTSYGACILHCAPEAAVGGPLALLRTGDRVAVDVPGRRLDMLVDEAELARRRAEWVAPAPHHPRGYGAIFARHVTQADQGCDFDVLAPVPGPGIPEPDIF
ncbi:MAG: dihydroxy-acid dehydratase [Rhodobacteraceae bacterium]|nr:dihydroxy-acid dehydratase [Paracoccaceae bacterium]